MMTIEQANVMYSAAMKSQTLDGGLYHLGFYLMNEMCLNFPDWYYDNVGGILDLDKINNDMVATNCFYKLCPTYKEVV